MSIRRHLPICCVLLAGVLTPASPARADDEQRIQRAKEILKLWSDGKYKEFVAAGDEKVRSLFSPEQAEQVKAQITFRLGDYQSVESAKLLEQGGYYSVDVMCRFTRGTGTLRVTLDQQDRMAGFHCMALKPNAPYEPPEYVDKSAFREEKVTVSAGQFPLPGTLALPRSGGPHPAVVLVHGSGPHDEDETVAANKPFRDLAWGLASRDVAVLRYVKRTKEHPTAKPHGQWTLDDETIDDALAAAKLLRDRPEIDPKRVFVLGHSLGGMAAPFIAARDDKLGGIIIMAGNARSILDLVEDQTEYLAKLDGDYSNEERAKIDELKQALAAIRAGEPEKVTGPILGVPAPYWTHLHSLDPAGTLLKLKVPTLIIHAGRDYQVTMTDFRLWKQRLGNRKNVTFKLFPQLNHLFIVGDGPSSPAEYERPGHVDEQVIEYIAEWVAARR
jgi:dienelactone hydrolase